VAVAIAAGFFSPSLRRQIAALEASGPESAEYKAAAQRQAISGIVVMIPVLLIIILMVNKPAHLF
jgi:hypothetical protein